MLNSRGWFQVLGALALLAAPCSAADELQTLRQAMDHAETQMDMNIAAGELARYWERELTSVEKTILTASDEEHGALLAASQKAWREFRAVEVDLQADAYRGGSIQPLIRNRTYATLTEQRVQELKKLLQEN